MNTNVHFLLQHLPKRKKRKKKTGLNLNAPKKFIQKRQLCKPRNPIYAKYCSVHNEKPPPTAHQVLHCPPTTTNHYLSTLCFPYY